VKIDVVTLFPEGFAGLRAGLVGRALDRGEASLDFIDPRDFTQDVHRTVDDQPFGGGGGMVLKVEPMAAAIREARRRGSGPVLLMTPQGRRLSQADLVAWSAGPHLVLVCGRYEGFDERIRGLCDQEVSVGDFVLTGGEPAACCVLDGVLRLLPGTLGNAASPELDSFSSGLDGLLEHPHYTRPPEWEGQTAPELLRSGDHAAVARWRRDMALERTQARRPDRLAEAPLGRADLAHLQDRPPTLGRAIWMAPERWNDELVDLLLGLRAAYDLERVFVGPDEDGAEGLAARLRDRSPLEVEQLVTRRKDRKRVRFHASDFEVVSGAAPVQAWLGPQGRWARCVPAEARAPEPLGRSSSRAHLQAAPRWVLAAGRGIPEAVPALPSIRRVRPGGAALPAGWHLALQLDRLVGEG